MVAAVTKTQAASAVWTGASAKPFLDIELAAASIADEDLGYEADTVPDVPHPLRPRGFGAPAVAAARDRGSVLTSGNLPTIAGLTLAPAKLPTGVDALVLDRRVFGYMGYERIPSPEYDGDPATGIETWARRDPDANDSWLVRGRRPVVPIIDNPNAARKITGVL